MGTACGRSASKLRTDKRGETTIQPFYVFDSGGHDYSLVHKADCPHCKQGLGKTNAAVGLGDQWIGAASLDEARKRAAALKRGKRGDCLVCKPGSA